MQPNDLDRIARQIRLRDLQAVYEAGAGHIGGEMSAIDILTALYFRVLRVSPDAPKRPDRDRFVLSKGHVALALYVTLAKRGFIPEEEIGTFLKPHSRLNGHPNCNKVPGVETNTGPLGHGLPVAVGMAKAAKLTGATYHTVTLAAHGTAYATMHDANGQGGYSKGQCDLTAVQGLRIYPPNQKGALFLPDRTEHCAGTGIHPLTIGPVES